MDAKRALDTLLGEQRLIVFHDDQWDARGIDSKITVRFFVGFWS